MNNNLVSTMQQLGPARLAIMGALVVGLLAFFMMLSLRVTNSEMQLLYADLSSVDSAAVAAKLESSDIAYEISADGARIDVPSKEVGRARMLLAAEGLPNGGSMGYEIFDKQSGFGTTNFVQNINQVRALEGELSRTIGALENIKSARVHLVLPTREVFSRENRQSSASVFLGIRSGSVIERQQILAIQSLVASAVPDLKPTNVSIIDSNGNLLQKGGEDEQEGLPLKAEEMRRSVEANLKGKIEEQVGHVVGFGKVTAVITAEVNFDRTSTNEEIFNPEGQVLRSTQTTQEGSKDNESENKEVTVGNNIPGGGDNLLGEGGTSSESNRAEEVNNYEISKTVRNTISDIGEIKRLSVSVLIDGRYTTDAEGKETYTPRPQEELDKISALVKTAVGLNTERGDTLEVINLQFAAVDTQEEFVDDRYLFGFEKSDLIDAGQFVLVLILGILVLLLVIQPMVNKLLAVEGNPQSDENTMDMAMLTANPANPALAPPSGDVAYLPNSSAEEFANAETSLINIEGVEGKVKASTVKKVEEIVDTYPKETVAVIRSWMTQET